MLAKIKNRFITDENYRCGLALAAALVLTLLNGFVIVPLQLATSTDVVYQETVLPALLYFLEEIFTYAVFLITAVSTAVFVYLSAKDLKKTVLFGVNAIVITAIRSLVDIFMTVAANSFRFRVLDADDFLSSFLKIFFDALVVAVVIFAGIKASRKHLRESEVYAKSYIIATGLEFDERTKVFPFRKFIDNNNPVQCGLFYGIIANLVIYVIDSIAGIIILAIADSSESFTASDLIITIFEFVFYALLSLILYTAGYFLCRLFLKNKSPEKAEINEVENE